MFAISPLGGLFGLARTIRTQNIACYVIYFSVGFTNSYNHIASATYNCGHQARVQLAFGSFLLL